MNEINNLVVHERFDRLITNYSVQEVCSDLNFNQLMHVVERLFYDDIQNDNKQQYALKLAFTIKEQFKDEWTKDWKNDVFLGGLCEMLWLYDERYRCYKRAYDSLQDPPAELLLLLANCISAPGTPPISEDEALYFINEAVRKSLTCETALAMRSHFMLTKDMDKQNYWNTIYEKLKNENVHSIQIIPNVLES